MYDFIYYVIYNQQLEKGKSLGFSRYNGCLIVAFTIWVHILFLFALLKTIFIEWFRSHIGKSNHAITGLFFVGVFGLVFYHYNIKRTEAILNRYSNGMNPTSVSNYGKVIGILFIPLILIAILASKF
jgi:hypothetical protein